jgi:hypothetical protein
MGENAGVTCTFCGAVMCLSRELPAAMQTQALRFFSCEICGASELRLVDAGTAKTPGRQDG